MNTSPIGRATRGGSVAAEDVEDDQRGIQRQRPSVIGRRIARP
jgi:hypothetical protein